MFSELFRFWPIGVDMDRICTKDFNLGKPNDKATSDYIVSICDLHILMKNYTTHTTDTHYTLPHAPTTTLLHFPLPVYVFALYVMIKEFETYFPDPKMRIDNCSGLVPPLRP